MSLSREWIVIRSVVFVLLGFASLHGIDGLPNWSRADEPESQSGLRVFRDVPYARVSEYQKLDLYLPTGDQDKVPLVVWIHGGAWRSGDKNEHPGSSLIEKGIAVASINYRLSTAAPYPAQLQDCQAAVRYLRANSGKYGIDPNRIGVWGASAGGHLAAMLGVMSSSGGKANRIQAVCDWCGPANLVTAVADTPKDCPLDIAETLWQLFLGPNAGNQKARQSIRPEQRRRILASASPVNYVSRKCPPFLVMHGDADNIVPIVQSERLVQALREVQARVEYQVVPGAGHGFRDRQDCMDQVVVFFQKHLTSSTDD